MTSLQPLSEYHGSENEWVQGEYRCPVAGYVFVSRVDFLIKTL